MRIADLETLTFVKRKQPLLLPPGRTDVDGEAEEEFEKDDGDIADDALHHSTVLLDGCYKIFDSLVDVYLTDVATIPTPIIAKMDKIMDAINEFMVTYSITFDEDEET